MNVRRLEARDAKRMLEWMHNENIIRYMGADFSKKGIDDCNRFIEESLTDSENLNLAVVDDDGVYMGTVSLKHIDKETNTAEFAIVMHADALGQGYAQYGMKEIIKTGLEQLGLDKIYWCVSVDNVRAVSFYNKHLYAITDEIPERIRCRYNEEQQKKLIWYVVESIGE